MSRQSLLWNEKLFLSVSVGAFGYCIQFVARIQTGPFKPTYNRWSKASSAYVLQLCSSIFGRPILFRHFRSITGNAVHHFFANHGAVYNAEPS